jgi:hypothetical protein
MKRCFPSAGLVLKVLYKSVRHATAIGIANHQIWDFLPTNKNKST